MYSPFHSEKERKGKELKLLKAIKFNGLIPEAG
jgi:hypothetical protein